MSKKPWAIRHFTILLAVAPDFVHADFDVELNDGNAFRHVKLSHDGQRFRLEGFTAGPDLTGEVLTAALAKRFDAPPA
ncbi:hypothetical protein G8E10_04815 [Rhizobiaceae bacterium CRRU44]|uniref:Uncharacterized protein n=1 Tax=Ferranicluibacter rubi TaxID=2715133 RepID=A0AA44C9R9_9HYPH|nr:hypothetical protein [Ferranicluibacter rubi]NHT75078.1 hypothetical protein [Ferranicluibacter rubi]